MRKLLLIAFASLATGCAIAPRGTDWTPMVDLKEGQHNSDYWRDLVACREYARQMPSGTDGAVATGIVGALIGAAISPRGMRSDGAGWGAFFGAPAGAETAVRAQESVVRNCLTGRGYRVLN
jgi:hypothetical protein